LLSQAGTAAWAMGDYEKAMVLHGQSLDLCQELGHAAGLAWAVHNVGAQLGAQGKWPEAVEWTERVRSLYAQVGNKWGTAFCDVSLGCWHLTMGDRERAAASFRGVIDAAHELGDHGLLAYGLENLGEVLASEGEYQQAARLFAEALPLFREVGDRRGVAFTSGFAGWAAARLGDHTGALVHHTEALRVSWQAGVRPQVATGLLGIAGTLAGLGRPEAAARMFSAAEALLASISHVLGSWDRQCWERDLAATREALDEATFSAAWAEGRAMPLQEVITYALDEVGKQAALSPAQA